MRERAKDEACESCHAPLARLVDPTELAVNEGVTCEVCHAIRGVEEGAEAGRYSFGLAENRKFGPLCDGKDNYFHKMGCAPFFREAKFCGPCHSFTMNVEGGGRLPIFTEWAEYSKSTFSTAGVTCQECHMPADTGPAATGTERKTRLGHHGFMGTSADLFGKALSVVADAAEKGGKIELELILKNEGAGHVVPSGMPGRQVVVRVAAVDSKGEAQAKDERTLGRTLVNEKGEEVPFYAARAERADERIAPGESKTLSFLLDAPRAGELRVEVVWRSASPAITKALDVAAEERPMARLTIPFGPQRKTPGREHLPKKVVIRP